ncbi:MAG: hypothetical protein ACOC41_02110 [Chitinivibrionales bacterium]
MERLLLAQQSDCNDFSCREEVVETEPEEVFPPFDSNLAKNASGGERRAWSVEIGSRKKAGRTRAGR